MRYLHAGAELLVRHSALSTFSGLLSPPVMTRLSRPDPLEGETAAIHPSREVHAVNVWLTAACSPASVRFCFTTLSQECIAGEQAAETVVPPPPDSEPDDELR